MPEYQDAGHRAHAKWTGEEPRNEIKEAPYHLNVTLDTWGPVDNLFPAIYDALQSNWGENPCRTVNNYQSPQPDPDLEDRTGWRKLSPMQREYVDSCFAGKTLPQVLERITFSFLVDGCTRASTHQLVRSRIGAAFMQHGGRDNDWRHRPWVMPETIRRACVVEEQNPESPNPTGMELLDTMGLKPCIHDWEPIQRLYDMYNEANYEVPTLRGVIEDYLFRGRQLYAALVDAGIPWEDARRLLWMGTSTYIHADYNYLAFKGVLERRLEHVMDWEINCIAQLMLREVKMKCPPLLSKYLGSMSDRLGKAAFAGLESWPPDGKYPNPYERCECGHGKERHNLDRNGACSVCWKTRIERNSNEDACRSYRPIDTLPREHRPEQNPFWVLHPSSMVGGPIKWIPTNGVYPHEELK